MRARSGFTLLEAAVAMAIIGIVSVGALSAFGANLRAADRARQMLPAASLAEEKMAQLELVDGRVLRMLPDSMAHGSFAAPFASYAWKAQAAEVRGETSLVEITIRITWPEGSYAIARRHYRPAQTNAGAGL